MKRICYLFAIAIIFLFYIGNSQAAVCCGGVCHDNGICCNNTWYIGCDSILGTLCPNTVLDECLVCECSSPDSCNWANYGSFLCPQVPQCQACSYDDINLPSYSFCLPTSDCVINGNCYLITQYTNEDCCYGTDLIDPIYADCHENGEIVGSICHYGPQVNNCTVNGWECYEEDFFDCSSLNDFDPSDNTLAESQPTTDTCDVFCSSSDCCEVTTYTCNTEISDGFGVCDVKNVNSIDYYCYYSTNPYIDTVPNPPAEICDDNIDNDCDGEIDDIDAGCSGGCVLVSGQWSTSCIKEGGVQLIVRGNDALQCNNRHLGIEIWEEDYLSKEFTIDQLSEIFTNEEFITTWHVNPAAMPDNDENQHMEYRFTATIGSSSIISDSPLVVQYCIVGDEDCDGEQDITDECLNTPPCASMDPEAPGCSIQQANALIEAYNVDGLNVNFVSFFLILLCLVFLLVYNFERTL